MGITAKLAKCNLGYQEIECVEHMIDLRQITPNDTKVKALLVAERPQIKKQRQSFLGFAIYYFRFLVNYAQLPAPHIDMLHKNKQFKWTDEVGTSFCTTKDMLAVKLVLMITNYDKQLYLIVNSCDLAIKAASMQIDDKGKYKLVYDFSNQLADAQRN